jgi:hypothetical protein
LVGEIFEVFVVAPWNEQAMANPDRTDIGYGHYQIIFIDDFRTKLAGANSTEYAVMHPIVSR